jgi:alkylglycerol monooxygenase
MEFLKPQVIAVPLFALTIALEAWYSVWKKADKYERVDTWANISIGFVSLAFGAVFGYILDFFYTGLYNVAPFQMPMNTVWPWPVLLFLDDFAYYWFHRISHESRLFWNFHVVHHSSERFNLSVAVRQSWFGGIAHWIFYIPLGFLGFPLWAFLTMHGFNLIYQYWIHTPFIKSLGPLEYVLNTPAHHRVHHAVNERYLDKNYAGVFIIWDRMFGSFEPETEEPRYGIIKPLKSFNWVWINTHAWFEMLAAMKERKTLGGKLRCLFASPSMDFVETTRNINYEK